MRDSQGDSRPGRQAEKPLPTPSAMPTAAKRPEDVCGPTQFRCVSTSTCIPASFHCDEESDCPDRSDEIGCSEWRAGTGRFWAPLLLSVSPLSGAQLSSLALHCLTLALISPVPPQVVTPPQESIQVSRGQTVTFTCVAIGVPTPIINWRLNWGHIPSHPRCDSLGPEWAGEEGRLLPILTDPTFVLGHVRVTMTSEGGRGTLTIRDVKESDQGAYTCEAMNARGMVFGIPDGVLELIPQRGAAGGGGQP